MKTKVKKKSVGDKIAKALSEPEEKKLTPQQLAVGSIIMKHTKGRPPNYRRFIREVRKLADKFSYTMDTVDKSSGMEVVLGFTYVGKIDLLLPEAAKLNL